MEALLKLLQRYADNLEEYFVVREAEIGTLQRLCDRLGVVIEKLNSTPQDSRSGVCVRAFRKIFGKGK